MPQKIHAIYVLSPQISYDTKEQARTFDTLVLFVPYNEPYLLWKLTVETGRVAARAKNHDKLTHNLNESTAAVDSILVILQLWIDFYKAANNRLFPAE